MSRTPLPRFDLIDMNRYSSMGVQFSRGCPFDCEFCDITKLYGRVPRTKSPSQVLREFDALFRLGWRGQVFLVDDNFIGNKRDALKLLPAVAAWQKSRRYPFTLQTEASINLVRLEALMDAMVEAGFDTVFVGIETLTPKALIKTKKKQNLKKGVKNFLFDSVRTLQQKGMQVQAGFILGLDGDDESVFDAQIKFIREAGIPLASIYLITALKGTDMYNRLKAEGRLLDDVAIGDNSMALNFRTELDPEVLLEGYKRVTTTLYDPALENYFERCIKLFENLNPMPHQLKPRSSSAIYTEIMVLQRRLPKRQVPAFLKFISKVAKRHPRMLSVAIQLAAIGHHLEKITVQQVAVQNFKERLHADFEEFEKVSRDRGRNMESILDRKQEMFNARRHAKYVVP